MFTQNWDLKEMFDWVMLKTKQRNAMYEVSEEDAQYLTWEIRVVNMLTYEDEGLYDDRQFTVLEAVFEVYEEMEYQDFEDEVIGREEVIQEYKTLNGWMNRYKKEVENAGNHTFVYHTQG